MSLTLPLLLTSLTLGQAYFTPAEADAIFAEGNAAWSRGDYAAAEASYQKLLERGFGGADVLYNLGTAHLAQDELGEAVLHLERAWRLGARGADLEANLALARQKQPDSEVGDPSHRTLLIRLTDALPLRPLALVFAFCWVAGFGLLLLRRLVQSAKLPLTAALAGVLLMGAGLSGSLLATHVWRVEAVKEAIVLAPSVPIHELPDRASKVTLEVHAGLKVRWIEAAGSFAKIRLPNGVEGWATQQSLSTL